MENTLDAKAVFLWLFSTVIVIFVCSAEEASGAATCTFQQGTTTAVVYCEDGCCGQDCCSPSTISDVDTTLILIIVGVIVGVIIVVLIIITVVCCLKDRKTDKDLEDKPATKLVHTNEVCPSEEADDPERPKLHRENAIFMVNGLPHAKAPHPRVSQLRETLTKPVHPDHSGLHGARRHGSNLRTSRVRHSDSVLPQVDEREELEAESVL